jgi:hypothetical protein
MPDMPLMPCAKAAGAVAIAMVRVASASVFFIAIGSSPCVMSVNVD